MPKSSTKKSIYQVRKETKGGGQINWQQRVMNGTVAHTPGGNTAANIKDKGKNATGKRYVSKARSAAGKANPWMKAVASARRELGISGFEPLRKSSPLYRRAKEIHGSSR